MVGLIGCGTMGSALIKGILKKELLTPQEVIIFDVVNEKAQDLKEELNVEIAPSAKDVCHKADMVFLAVKPQDLGELLDDIKGLVTSKHTIISIAAGIKISFLRSKLSNGTGPSIIRLMPNTPCLVGAGITAIAAPGVPGEEKEKVMSLIGALGLVTEIKEKFMDAATGFSASGPAFIFYIIEALADAGVEMGLPREQSEMIAAQTVMGSAKMVLETKQHPARLKNMVTSPGGTASRGLLALENGAVKSHIMKAVVQAAQRATELSKTD